MNKINKLSSTALFVGALVLASATPALAANYGSSPSGGSSGPSVCNNQLPGTATIVSVKKTGGNEIELGWTGAERATSWTLSYGKKPGQYTYGVANFGDNGSRSIKIGMLPAGIYYAVIKANNGCTPGGFSAERRITVSAGGSVLGATTTRRTTTGKVLGAKTVAPKVNTAPAAPVVEQQAPVAVQQPIASPAPIVKEGFFRKLAKFFGM